MVAHRERAAGRESGVAGSNPACEAPYLRRHLSIESFRRAVESGLSVKRETASAFKPRTIGQLMDSHLAPCPSFLFGMGRCASVIALGSSPASEHLVKARRCGFTAFREANVSFGHLTCRTWEVHSGWGLRFSGEWLSGNSRPHRSRICEPWRCKSSLAHQIQGVEATADRHRTFNPVW